MAIVGAAIKKLNGEDKEKSSGIFSTITNDYLSKVDYGKNLEESTKQTNSDIQSLLNNTGTASRTNKTYQTSSNKTMADYGKYEYTDYQGSEKANQWYDKAFNAQKPVEQQSQWTQGLNDALNKILNREEFSYDLNGDALYQQYKDQYMLGGQMAMQDTIGQASALTGGYGNSYAQGVGQQAYQGYLQKLNDKVPELYQLALDQYNREGEELYNQYGILADRENTEHNRYREEVSDYYTDRGFYADQYNTEEDRSYNRYMDKTKLDYSIYSDNRDFEHTLNRDAVSDAQYQQNFDETQYQFDVKQGNWEKEFEFTVLDAERNYNAKVAQIQEDVRHNKITEEQGQQQIDLAKAELQEEKRQANLNYNLALAQAKKKVADEDEDPYEGWGASDFASFLSEIRSTEGQAAAEAQLELMIKEGSIPQKYVAAASVGARGSMGH